MLWNIVYLHRALAALRAQDYSVLDTDVERLSAFVCSHIGIDGQASFHLPDLAGAHRPLRGPDTLDNEYPCRRAPMSIVSSRQTPVTVQMRHHLVHSTFAAMRRLRRTPARRRDIYGHRVCWANTAISCSNKGSAERGEPAFEGRLGLAGVPGFGRVTPN
ncbi:hypothetical protein [Rhodococcus jostii]|uniref:hypothetical protein n=1 Tax=Rhodococcus jostii TaxID=132919 RepID=UPI00363838C1